LGKRINMVYKKEYKKQYYIKNREKLLKKASQYRKNNPEKIRQYRKNHRKEQHKKNKQYYKEFRKFIDEYKLSKGCAICGYKKCAAALDFHHKYEDKKFGVSRYYGFKKLKEEMEKCEILCANCHRELHNDVPF